MVTHLKVKGTSLRPSEGSHVIKFANVNLDSQLDNDGPSRYLINYDRCVHVHLMSHNFIISAPSDSCVN